MGMVGAPFSKVSSSVVEETVFFVAPCDCNALAPLLVSAMFDVGLPVLLLLFQLQKERVHCCPHGGACFRRCAGKLVSPRPSQRGAFWSGRQVYGYVSMPVLSRRPFPTHPI
eukprot:GGOE01009657.1.p4 GENE.GGOE01009657.1~~GGOE01009657.1.p4  ORF type:complete len:112 (-),score=1.74 GGOE01009657.1:485-820(-)